MPNSSSNDKDKDKTNSSKTFQPEPHLETRDGLSYLPLKWRLAWLRTEQPEAQVATRLVTHENGLAVFQARIKLPGGGLATGWGARARATDSDNSREVDLAYITEAENLALERALTVLGYGTEYSFDFDTPVENEPIALNVVSLPVPSDRLTPAGPATGRGEQNSSATKPYTLLHATTEPVEQLAANEPEASESEAVEADSDADDEPLEVSGSSSNLRSLNSSRSSGVTPRPDNVTQLPTPASNRASTPPRPALPKTPAATTPPASSPTIGSSVINERLRGIEDPALRLAIKQIYTEAHRLYGLDETKVDQRSIRIYELPANELSLEQAEEYLERIKNGIRRNQ
jgi:hypothetical protein